MRKKKVQPSYPAGLNVTALDATRWRLEVDLTTLTDPFLRLGAHGLYRFLKHWGKNLKSWEIPLTVQISPMTLTVEGECQAFERAAWYSVGDFAYGLATFPGYPEHPTSEAFIPTLMAQKGLAHFGSANGVRRSRVVKDEFAQEWENHTRRALVRKIPCGDSSLTVQPQAPTWAAKIGAITMPKLEPYALGDWSDPIKLSSAYHPSMAAWNNKAVTRTELEGFILWFSPLAYLWVMHIQKGDGGGLGLGVDLTTFTAADTFHMKHAFEWGTTILSGAPGKIPQLQLIRTYGSEDFAVRAMLELYGLPHGCYHVIGPKSGFHVHRPNSADNEVRSLVAAAIKPLSQSSPLAHIRGVEMPSGVTVADAVFYNLKWLSGGSAGVTASILQHGPWARGLQSLFERTAPIKDPKIFPLSKEENDMLSRTTRSLESQLEKNIRIMARKLYERIAHASAAYGGDRWERANLIMLRTHLPRVHNSRDLMGTLVSLAREAECSYPLWTNEMLTAMCDLADREPEHLRNLLSVSTLIQLTAAEKQEFNDYMARARGVPTEPEEIEVDSVLEAAN